MKPYPDKQKRKLNLPLTEFSLVQHMTSYRAHADDLVQLSICELMPEEIDCLYTQYNINNKKR